MPCVVRRVRCAATNLVRLLWAKTRRLVALAAAKVAALTEVHLTLGALAPLFAATAAVLVCVTWRMYAVTDPDTAHAELAAADAEQAVGFLLVTFAAVVGVVVVVVGVAAWGLRRRRPTSALFVYNAADGSRFGMRLDEIATKEWRVYVVEQPAYLHRSVDPPVTHRYLDRDVGLHYVCWSRRLRSPRDAYHVAVAWAEATCAYIATGRFDPPDTAAAPPDPEPASPLDRLLISW